MCLLAFMSRQAAHRYCWFGSLQELLFVVSQLAVSCPGFQPLRWEAEQAAKRKAGNAPEETR